MQEIIKSLKSSPLFNLSLSSKELFHSNFIAWLISEYPNEMWSIFSKCTELEPDKYKIEKASAHREKEHIDLMFDVEKIGSAEGKIKIIIENKVKSLPYKKQLEEYSTKFPGCCYILLSLSKPKHLINESNSIFDEKNYWHLLTYENLANELENISFNYEQIEIIDTDSNAQYHKMIIADYINFTRQLVQISNITDIWEEEKFDWYDKNNEIFSELAKIRLADFYIKKKCENLSIMILAGIKDAHHNNYIENSISISSSIVNGTNGEFRLYYKLNNRITISIEGSGMYYRKMVHLSNQKNEGKSVTKYEPPYDIHEVAKFFNDQIHWFDFSQIDIEKIDQKYKSRKHEDFNGFGDTSRYLQCMLNSTNTINDIINYFVNDFKLILQYKELITSKYK